ncbi:hypothetical protein RHGRI_013630 [Rhododendron griersonianum]|uniref:Uncharacterized protein n=1 Tax=Rhododendron griersonianum TaxID=479676 RepID=A0AAV6K6L9_9ERIC|nr:hypothetical protein RHGRI_013630 [Rhododendron griersonianum]
MTEENSSLALLKDSLVVICSFYEDGCTTFVLWLMKANHEVNDDDPESSWFRVSTWGPLPGFYSPLGFWENNEVLIQTRGNTSEFHGSQFLYDIVTQKRRELKRSG